MRSGVEIAKYIRTMGQSAQAFGQEGTAGRLRLYRREGCKKFEHAGVELGSMRLVRDVAGSQGMRARGRQPRNELRE